MVPDAELYAGLWEQYQDLAAGMRAIREAMEQAFGATLAAEPSVSSRCRHQDAYLFRTPHRHPE